MGSFQTVILMSASNVFVSAYLYIVVILVMPNFILVLLRLLLHFYCSNPLILILHLF